MSDEFDYVAPVFWQRFIAESQARAREFLATAPRCDVCGQHVATYGRTRHCMCEPGTLVGHACTCRQGCTTRRWGDGPTPCDPACRPCTINHGQLYAERKRKG